MGHSSSRTLHASPAQLALSLFALMALTLSLFAFANPVRATHADTDNPVVADGSIAIFKQMCASIGDQNTCNGRDTSLKDYKVDFTVQSTTGEGDDLVVDPEPIHTITVTLGDNAGGGGNLGNGSQGRSLAESFDIGTYLVCEVEKAYKTGEADVPLDAVPRPDESTGGSNQFSPSEDRCILVTLTGGAAELKFLDQRADVEPRTTDVNLLKRDDDGRALAGIEFTLDSNTTSFSVTATTGANGTLIFEDLFEDEYTLTETTPVGCTGISELTVTVNADGTVTVESDPRVSFDAATNTISIRNDCGSPLNLVKVNQAGTALSGVSFTLTASGQTTGTTLATNAQGTVTFPDLDPGNYTLAETAPAGCTGIGSITLTIAANGNVTLSSDNSKVAVNGNTLTIRNNCPPPPTGTLPLLKVDNATPATTRGGAVFTLTGTGFNATATTTAAGTASFTGLVAGDYSLAETTAPTGCTGVTGAITIRVATDGTVSTIGTLPAGVTFTSGTLRVVNDCPIREQQLGGNPTPTPVVRQGTLAGVPNTAMEQPMDQLPVVLLALLTVGSIGYLGRRNLVAIQNRR